MLLNTLFAVVFFVLVFVGTTPGLEFRVRLAGAALGLLVLAWIYSKSQRRGIPLPFLDWLACDRAIGRYFPLALVFLSVAILFKTFSPREGIQFTYTDPASQPIMTRDLDLPEFDINPTLFLPEFLSCDQGTLRFSATFYSTNEVHYALPHASCGHAVWKLDGAEIARFEPHESSRHRLIPVSIQPGIHEIECETSSLRPIPRLSIAFSEFSKPPFAPLQGPFIQGIPPVSMLIYPIARNIPPLFLLLAFFLMIPIVNRGMLALAGFGRRNPSWLFGLGLILGIAIYTIIRFQFQTNTRIFYEADEAAFGLMAQRLLLGQSPPLFHYGQQYQGTLEAYPLALSLYFSEQPAAGLHALPEIWGILFLGVTCLTFWRFGSPALAGFALLILGVGGLHYHWIFSKTWFGYSFALVCGACQWLIVLAGWKQERLSPGMALVWGMLAGLSFYELPISLPFFLGSGLLILFFAWRNAFRLWFGARDAQPILKSILNICILASARSGAAVAGISLIFFTAPYWISPFLGQGLTAIEFVAKGRELPAARVSGENPLIDRFFGECLPVMFGSRAPYDHQHDLRNSLFSWFPSFLFLASLTIFPWSSRRSLKNEKILSALPVRLAVYGFALSTVLFVSYSPFGVWPWYAIPLYWVLPVLLYAFIRSMWEISPSLSAMAMILYLSALISPFGNYSPLFHQPASLAYQGLFTPTQFDEIKAILQERAIRYLLCDQGFDYLTDTPGRDWVGECLAFDSEQNILAFGRLSRRLEDSAQEIVNASRVGYLFHKNFQYNNTTGDPSLYSPLTIEVLERLFGPQWLGYERFMVDPYIVFLPPSGVINNPKNSWRLEASNPNYRLAAADHNISVRAYNRETYWSSDAIPASGAFFRVEFPSPQPVSKLVLFHGTKSSDRTRENHVILKTPEGKSIVVGSLHYEPEILSSVLVLNRPIDSSAVEIHVSPTPDNNWWTIFEIWIL